MSKLQKKSAKLEAMWNEALTKNKPFDEFFEKIDSVLYSIFSSHYYQEDLHIDDDDNMVYFDLGMEMTSKWHGGGVVAQKTTVKTHTYRIDPSKGIFEQLNKIETDFTSSCSEYKSLSAKR